MSSLTIGIDLGGTRIKGVVLDDTGKILHQHYSATNDGDGATWKKAIISVVDELCKAAGTKETTVGISAPGICNEGNTAVAFMPGRLQGLENFQWCDHLSYPAWVLNDAMAALMAESRL